MSRRHEGRVPSGTTLVGIAAAVSTLSFTGCAGLEGTTTSDTSSRSATCGELLSDALALERSGQTGDGRIDSTLESLRFCDDEYDTFIEEATGLPEVGPDEDVVLPEQQPGGGLSWDEAAGEVGSFQRVCGPLATIRNSSDDVFLNIGRDYPDSSRFTIVVWDIGGIESIAAGTTVCAEGPISVYNGVAQIELRSASDVELWE